MLEDLSFFTLTENIFKCNLHFHLIFQMTILLVLDIKNVKYATRNMWSRQINFCVI